MAKSMHDSTIELPLGVYPRSFRLRVLFEGRERSRLMRRGNRVVLGSCSESDVRVLDPTVSARHCEISALDEGLRIRDLGSKNGIFVGSGRIDSFVFSGRKLRFSMGQTTVILEAGSTSQEGEGMGLLGTSELLARVRDRIRQFAPLRGPVLISGESGTGKDVVARALHSASGRGGAYCPLNVAALSENLLDGELFGHERGAFTGALGSRKGMFEAADRGTLFLDEIAEMSASGQAKLLRVVEDGQVRAVGAESSRQVDVRLVSASCSPLQEEISRGRFRHDLFHRISPLAIHLPPLRKRSEDIPILARFYLKKIAGEVGEKTLIPSTEELLRRLPWHGNVRELFGALYRAAALSNGDCLDPSYFELPSKKGQSRAQLGPERAVELLDIHGTISAAARAVGVPRTTFRSVLDRKGRA